MVVGTTVGATVGLIAATVGTAHAASAAVDGLDPVAVRQSLLGTHTWYQQTYRGLPVLGGYYATHTDAATGAVTVQDGRLDGGRSPAASPPASPATAPRPRSPAASAGAVTVRAGDRARRPGPARPGWC